MINPEIKILGKIKKKDIELKGSFRIIIMLGFNLYEFL